MKLLDMMQHLVEFELELTMKKSEGVMCAYFQNGFYQSDGDAYLKQSDNKVELYTRFDGFRAVDSLELLTYESHLCWRKAKNLHDRWQAPARGWLPLYKKYKLEIFYHQ